MPDGRADRAARIAPGIAWAEEPKAFVADLGDSFTTTRAKIIRDAIDSDEGDVLENGFEDFVKLVNQALADRFVDPDNPHRHLPGNEPAQGKVRKRKTPSQPTPPRPALLPKVIATPTPLLVSPSGLVEPVSVPTTSPKPAAKIAAKLPGKPLPPLPTERIVT